MIRILISIIIFINASAADNCYVTPYYLRHLCTTHAQELVQLLTRLTLAWSCFNVVGPKLWNGIPPNVRCEQSLAKFKTALDSFLLKVPDRPPVAGYSTANRNSILDWVLHLHE